MSNHTVVIGAGITGLTAAHTIRKAGRAVTVIESSDRVGGRITLLGRNGDFAESGAQGIHSNYREMLKLIDEYDMRKDLIPQQQKNIGILDRHGKIKIASGIGGLLSVMNLRGKADFMKFAAKYMLFGKKFDVFETLVDVPEYDKFTASEVLSWAGRDFRDFVLRPSTDAMVNTTPEYSSFFHVLNLFKSTASSTVSTLRSGNSSLAEKMARKLNVEFGVGAEKILLEGDKVCGVLLADGRVIKADHVVVACPAGRAIDLFPDSWNYVADFYRSFKTAPFVMTYFFLDRPLKTQAYVYMGHGYRDAVFNMAINHGVKTPHLIKSGKSIVSAWTSFPNSAEWISKSDEEISTRALSDIEPFFPGIAAQIEEVRIQRHQWGIGLLEPGQYGMILEFKRRTQFMRGVSFASNDFDGVHMESGVGAGIRAGMRALGDV